MTPACPIALRVLSACQHVAIVDVTCLHCAGFTKSRPKGLHVLLCLPVLLFLFVL